VRLRSPAEFYIKGLVVDPHKYSTDYIKKKLLDEGLDFLSERYIDDMRTSVTVPEPFYPGDPTHAASFAFLCREGINRMFQKDLAMKMALGVLAKPRAKEFVESMLLGDVPLSAIAGFVSRKRGVYCTPEGLQTYAHYFWNLELLDSTQMRVLLELRVEVDAANIPELKDRKSILRHAYYKDPRKVAADLPYSPTAAMLTQLRLGLKPPKHELALRILEARDLAAARAVEAATLDGPGDSLKFLNYANGSRILEEFLQMTMKPEDQMREQLRSIALRRDTQPLPSIHQLSAGEHTVEISPTKDLEHDESGDIEPQPGDVNG
jgi:hypothetical protein